MILLLSTFGTPGSRVWGRGARDGAFAPDPGAPGAPSLSGGRWNAETAAYAAELELVDEIARREFVKRRTGSPADPFATLPGQPPGLLTFLLKIENRGRGDLVFEPDAVRLLGRAKEVLYPIGWPDIQSAYDLLGREVPPVQALARGLLLDGQKVVRPGGEVEGILVFRLPPPGTKSFRLEIALTLPDGASAGLGAPYKFVRK